MNLFSITALAESGAAEGAAQNPNVSAWGSIIYLLVIVALFYFVAILPQKKREKKTRSMLDAIVVGDEVITIGGINGKIVSIKDDKFVIESGTDRVKITIEKWAVKETLTIHD